MRSQLKTLLSCAVIGLCITACAYRDTPNSGAIRLVLSFKSDVAGAKGTWTWQSYFPWGHGFQFRDSVQIEIRDEIGNASYSSFLSSPQLEWISGGGDQAEKSGSPVHFTLALSSGEFDFHGKRTSRGMDGEFIFKPSARFVSDVKGLCGKEPTLDELIKLGFANATIEGLWRYQAAVVSMDAGRWLQLIYSGVTPDYAADMRWALGRLEADVLIECHNSGMAPEFASGYTRAGYAFSYKDLIKLHQRGIQPQYAAELKQGGMRLTVEQLIKLHNSGTQPAYVLRIRESRLGESVDDIVKTHNSGVSEDYIAAVKRSGYYLSLDEIIKLHNSGVQASYLSTAKKAGYSFTVDEAIMLHNRGVSENYLTEIIQPGHKPLSAEKIANLYSRGISAEMVRDIRAE